MLSAMTASTGADGTCTHAERRQRERDAVRDGERGDRLHQQAHAAHDEHQREHEEQMIDAKEDVLDAQPEVSARRRSRGFLA